MKQRTVIGLLVLAVLLWLMPDPLQAKATAFAGDTGGIQILKTDAAGNPLPGAVFRIAREAGSEEGENGKYETEWITADGREIEVIYETFHSDSGLEGRLLWEAETDSRGETAMYGLSYGTHYLIETQAPQGYKRIAQPIRVTVNKYSHLTADDAIQDDAGVIIDNTIHIINLQSSRNENGRSIAFLIFVGAIGMMSSAMALWLLRRRK